MYDLIVLGGGSGGLNVAAAAAKVGARVALVEKYQLGGECTHFACVPSKALIHAARLVHQIRSADAYGIKVDAPEVDFAAVMERVRGVVASFAGSDSGDSLRAKGIDVYRGSPSFEAYDTLLIDGATRLHAHRFVIATGSRADRPDVPGMAEANVLDNVSIWDLTERPESLVIVGGGPVGVEFGQAFARLGSRVTIVTHSAILPREDPEVSRFLQGRLEAEGMAIRTEARVTGVSTRAGRTVCAYTDRTGQACEVSCTHLLVATGRLANVEGLNLDSLGIHASARDGIEVDDYLQTHATRILAIGDVLQRAQFTHAAEREAAVAFQNAVLRLPKKIDYTALPWATFVDPEVATVGLTESEATKRHSQIRVFRAEFSELDRARIDGQTDGFAKVIATPSGKILGATVVGAEAAMIVQEFTLAIENQLSLSKVAATIHTYPTYAGMARKLANQFVATRLDGKLVQTALRYFYGFIPRTGDNGTPEETKESAVVH